MQRTMTEAGEEDSEPEGKLQHLSTDYKVNARMKRENVQSEVKSFKGEVK